MESASDLTQPHLDATGPICSGDALRIPSVDRATDAVEELVQDASGENPYDRVPYPKSAHPGSHPRRLEALATLFGMRPAALPKARVLELGCAAGWNLIPQAVDYQLSHFVGVDLSAGQIAAGRQMVDSLGLENIELRHGSILEIDDSWGSFDYILCHGVFSWVPQEIQNKILAICKENLSPEGVAYVSYNVFPGWNLRLTIREMMLYHVAQFTEPRQQIAQARAVLDFMVENCSADTTYGQLLREELEVINSAGDDYLFHDHMEENNSPVYFHQFVERAESAGLQYLGDIDFASMLPKFLTPKASAELANAPLVKQEQYMDFLRNRAFRRTLLCHQQVSLNRSLHAGLLDRFQLTLPGRPSGEAMQGQGNGNLTLTINGRSLNTNSQQGRAAITALMETWPQAVSTSTLRQVARDIDSLSARSEKSAAAEADESLAAGLMEAYSAGLLEIALHPPQLVGSVSDCPQVTPWVRLQAERGSMVTNQLHENVSLGPVQRRIAMRLDGQHDSNRLCQGVEQDLADGSIKILSDDPLSGNLHPKNMAEAVEATLESFRQTALLIG